MEPNIAKLRWVRKGKGGWEDGKGTKIEFIFMLIQQNTSYN